MKSLSENIADFYIKKNIIKSDMKSVYVYGISLIINDIVDFIVILAAAALLRHFMYGIVFLLTFCLTRVHCGGFHAKKSWICAMTMLVTFILIYAVTEITSPYYNLIWGIIVGVISVIMLLPVIPVENPNKKLSKEVKIRNRKIGLCVTIVFLLLSFVLTVFGIPEGTIIAFTILSVAILAVIGTKINQRR